jgi:hypothetical protein
MLLLCVALLVAGCATPYEGGQSALGGVSETLLSEDAYAITAQLNGFAPPGQLKPMIVRKARAIGARHAFASFEIERSHISYNPLNTEFSASAVVRFFRSPEGRDQAGRYRVDAADDYRAELRSSDTQGLARIRSSVGRDEPTRLNLGFVPVFVDAVSASQGFVTGEVSAQVRPGRHAIWAWIVVHPMYAGAAPLTGDLQAGGKLCGRWGLPRWCSGGLAGRREDPGAGGKQAARVDRAPDLVASALGAWAGPAPRK